MTLSTKRKPSQHILFSALIYFCFVGWAYGQEQNFKIPDSLKNKSSKELAQVIKTANQGEAAFYERVVLKHQEKDAFSNVYKELGKRFYKEENYTKAHKYLDKALTITTSNNDEEATCIISILKANAYLLDGKNQEAIHFYDRAITIAQKREDVQLEIIATSSYVSLLSQMDDQLEKALEISNKLLLELEKSSKKNTKSYVQILTTINDVFLGAGQYDKVLLYADKGIRVADSLGYTKGVTDLYIKKGIAHYYNKNIKKSYLFLAKAKNLIEENRLENDFHQKVKANYFLAKLKNDEGLYPEAIEYLTAIINDIEEEDVNKLPIIQTYYLLMDSYREMGNDDEAWRYHKLYTDSNLVYQKSEDEARSSVFKRENQIGIEKERQLTNLEKTNKKYAQIGLFIVLVILGLVGYRFWRKQKINKTLFNNLIHQIDQLESQNKNKEPQEKKKSNIEINIDDDKVHAVLKGLDRLEKQEYFLKPDCNLRTIAKKTKTNATYLSKIINTHKGKNFNGYINDLRIEYALEKLKKDRRFRSFSIASIALDVGYKSDKSFVKHFKSKTGINPSYYIKNVEVLEKEAASAA
jgi:AraC-like DNA-binding protein